MGGDQMPKKRKFRYLKTCDDDLVQKKRRKKSCWCDQAKPLIFFLMDCLVFVNSIILFLLTLFKKTLFLPHINKVHHFKYRKQTILQKKKISKIFDTKITKNYHIIATLLLIKKKCICCCVF